ncbi:unnamed protein product [Symbiodinium sp. CCMP2592]|nr:unnamed protein product [Symbiodinium sp. CCMP2592]
MSVDTPTEKKCDEWWGDESWHSAWDAHGWDSWYRRTPSSWDGWGWGSGSWSAGDWQASSVQWGRRGAVEEIKAEEESQPDLETLLERAYESYGESDSGSEKEKGSRSLRSLDSATTLALGSLSRESLEEPPIEKGIETEEYIAKTVQEDTPSQRPEDEPSTGVPEDKPSTGVPEDKPSTGVPEDKPSTGVPEHKPSTGAPEHKPSTVPEDKPSTGVPEDKPSTGVPEDKPSTGVPEDKPSTVPEDKPSTVPQDKPSTVPEDKPSTVSEDKPGTEVPEDKPSTKLPEQKPSTSVPQDKQQSGADTAAGGQAPPPVQEANQLVPNTDDSWRRDKYGVILSPPALYARFYRSGRMAMLEEIYVWKTLKFLRAELGDSLANDLYSRHLEIDPRMTGKLLQKHPNFPKEMTLLKSFDTIKDISQKTFENSAEFQMEAENVDEEDMHDAMWLAPTDGNVPPPNPKPREPKKAKKEKTWRDKAQDAT